MDQNGSSSSSTKKIKLFADLFLYTCLPFNSLVTISEVGSPSFKQYNQNLPNILEVKDIFILTKRSLTNICHTQQDGLSIPGLVGE